MYIISTIRRCGYAYQPNKNILYPDEDQLDDEEEEKKEEGAEGEGAAAELENTFEMCGETGVARRSDMKRKALASPSPSPHKPATRNTPRSRGGGKVVADTPDASHSLAKKADEPGSAQDEVTMKRRMLRAKLAEADSPLPPPSCVIP